MYFIVREVGHSVEMHAVYGRKSPLLRNTWDSVVYVGSWHKLKFSQSLQPTPLYLEITQALRLNARSVEMHARNG